MHSLQLRTRRATLCSVVIAALASVGLLGGAAALFAGAGKTPTFVEGSKLAREASSQCPQMLTQARHECLRNVAAVAARSFEQGVTLVARASSRSN